MNFSILINEFLPDPVGVDKGWEWIELVNISNEQINLSSWEIQVAGIRYNKSFQFPSGSTILPRQYILICEQFVENCDYYTTQLAIQNGGKETDGVRILNAKSEVIDTVLYDTTNLNNLLNDFNNIEIDENIVEMPPTGCSLSRRYLSDTNFSKKDFSITCQPTPRKENIFPESVVISEVGIDFIEFYSSNIPNNLEKWYFKESESGTKKFFLENNFKNNFFYLKTTTTFKNILLYSSNNVLIDSFVTKNITNNYTLCRLNSDIKENFTFCEKTQEEKNSLKDWKPINILEIIQREDENPNIIKPCIIYKYEDYFIISDETAAIATQCESCEINKCYLGEISFLTNLYIIEESTKREMTFETLNKVNYYELFNKIVFLEAKFLKTEGLFSFFQTDAGLIKIAGNSYSKNILYTFKGILTKDENLILELKFSTIAEQKVLEESKILEQTGDPLIFLLFFFITPFFLSKIFVKLLTIKFKKLIL